MIPLLLASSSAYRAKLLARLRVDFRAVSPDIDESGLPGESAAALVARLAEAKARGVAVEYPNALIIGSDQVAVRDLGDAEVVLGKPLTPSRAREQLRELSGRRVKFMTSLCLLNAVTDNLQLEVIETPVAFRALTEHEIARYVELEQPLDCAGAFKSEGLGTALFESIGGDDPSALIGLPLIRLCTMLRAEGVSVLA